MLSFTAICLLAWSVSSVLAQDNSATLFIDHQSSTTDTSRYNSIAPECTLHSNTSDHVPPTSPNDIYRRQAGGLVTEGAGCPSQDQLDNAYDGEIVSASNGYRFRLYCGQDGTSPSRYILLVEDTNGFNQCLLLCSESWAGCQAVTFAPLDRRRPLGSGYCYEKDPARGSGGQLRGRTYAVLVGPAVSAEISTIITVTNTPPPITATFVSVLYLTTTVLSAYPVTISSTVTRIATLTSSVTITQIATSTLPDRTTVITLVQVLPTTLFSTATRTITATSSSTQVVVTVVPTTVLTTVVRTATLQTTVLATQTVAVVPVQTVTPRVTWRSTTTVV